MQSIGYKSDANNSNGFGVDKGKYIAYDFKEKNLSFKELAADLVKNNPGLKLDGLNSDTRIPAIGDYNKFLSEAGFLQIHGSVDFLNYIKVPVLLESIGNVKSRLLILVDNLNYKKSLLNKFLPLDQTSHSNLIEDQ